MAVSRALRLGFSLRTYCTCRVKNARYYTCFKGGEWKNLNTGLLLNSTIRRCFFTEHIPEEKDNIEKRQFNLERVLQYTPNFQADLDKNAQWTDLEWKSIRNNTLLHPTVTESNVDAIIMDACLLLNKSHVAMLYYHFLQNNGYSLNRAVLNKHLKTFFFKPLPLSKEDQKKIYEIHKKCHEEASDIDMITAETLALALCLTDEWQKAEVLLEKSCIDHFSIKAYSGFINTALDKGASDIAWKYMKQLFEDECFISSCILNYAEYVQKYSTNRKQMEENLEKMFNLWERHGFYPSGIIAKRYSEICKEVGWSVNNTFITENGVCSCCNGELQRLTLSDHEFKLLADTVIEKVVHSTDLFKNTNPQELRQFQKYITYRGKFDIIIDGLNLFYCNKPRFIDIIEHFLAQKKRVFMIIRKHMLKNRKIANFLEKNTTYFITHHLTKDDIYILYATIIQGKNASFLSNDLMRQHSFALKDNNLKMIFRKWQFMRQYTFEIATSKKTPIICEPFTYIPNAQKNLYGWHIPTWDYVTRPTVDVYRDEVKWLCLKKRKTNYVKSRQINAM